MVGHITSWEERNVERDSDGAGEGLFAVGKMMAEGCM